MHALSTRDAAAPKAERDSLDPVKHPEAYISWEGENTAILRKVKLYIW